ncbi:MAG: Ureidoglycolate hydrolase [Alphaproteobacteria bacterium]|nr:MAG: Ureidoglycolate hydrolase [Alphaproteobacteria bacterium]
MSAREILTRPLTAEAFAPFGAVIEVRGEARRINAGACLRYHALAEIDVAGRAGISVFASRVVALPCRFDLVERHPLGSQAFIPMSDDPFLVIVAPDAGGVPGNPCAFITNGAQGVSYGRGVWHGVLTPLSGPGLFAVVDRIAPGDNLEEFRYPAPFELRAP